MPLQATAGAATYDAFGGGVTAATYIEEIFQTWLYTGNGSTQTITNGIDLSGKGGLVWCKNRAATDGAGNTANHALIDSATGGRLRSNTTGALLGSNVTLLSTGFSVTGTELNYSGDSLVSWTFRKQPKFFDVVTYTGTGAVQNIAHSLESTPGCIIVKCTSNADNWGVWHRSLNNSTGYLLLNSTAASGTSASLWGNTAPTSTTFTVGNNGITGASGFTYVAYLFAHDAGGFGASGTDNVISCGVYSGSTPVNLGFEPQWVLIKPSSTAGTDWYVFDNMRGWPVGTGVKYVNPNTSAAEAGGGTFKLTSTGFVDEWLGYSNTIYIAIRRGPMKTPTSGTSVYTSASRTGTASVIPRFTSNFVVDWALRKSDVTAGGGDWQAGDRLRGAVQVKPNLTEAETAASPLYTFDSMTGYSSLGASGSDTADRSWMFGRAPGFFDVVCYTGTGANRTVNHNLGVVPEMIIGKSRTQPFNWGVYHAAVGNTAGLYLNATDTPVVGTYWWNNTSPTSSVVTLGSGGINGAGDANVMYLFASCPGVSKVGSYTGNGSSQTINCGFTTGARFVLIKRTDSTGDWYVWDSARGIVAGNDPYLLLNSTAAEVTSTDYVDTYNAGFEISSTAPAAINANGGTFIFLAIA